MSNQLVTRLDNLEPARKKEAEKTCVSSTNLRQSGLSAKSVMLASALLATSLLSALLFYLVDHAFDCVFHFARGLIHAPFVLKASISCQVGRGFFHAALYFVTGSTRHLYLLFDEK